MENIGIQKAFLKKRLYRLQLEWDRKLEPSPSYFTVNDYRQWPLWRLEEVIKIQDEMKQVSRELWSIRFTQVKNFFKNLIKS